MTENITESEFQELSNSEPMDLIEITTNEGNVYKITLRKRIGGTWKGVACKIEKEKSQLFHCELRYGKGFDGDNDEPFIAVSRGQEVKNEEMERYVVTAESEDMDDFILNHESYTISYDEHVVNLEHYGQRELKLG